MYCHIPVMLNECLDTLKNEFGNGEEKMLIDCNLGEGGHSEAFLNEFEFLNIVALDRDRDVINSARERLKGFGDRIKIINTWSNDFLKKNNNKRADCVFFDFGISMYHYKNSERGFSFSKDEKLDMRLDDSQILKAYDVVNFYRENQLADVIYNYSGEKKSRKIAKAIIEKRKYKKIETTFELKSIIDSCFSAYERKKSDIQPSTKTFQAIRIEVNNELERMKGALNGAFNTVKVGGIIMAITFHSLEDGIVKWAYRDFYNKGIAEIITKKPIVPSREEVESNPASRSAKLRILRRVA